MASDDPETSADLDGHAIGCDPSKNQSCDAHESAKQKSQAPAEQTPAEQTAAQQQSPYQKYIEEQNKPITEADKANALVQAGKMGDAGVKAGLAVVGAEVVVAGAVVAAPAVAATASQAATTVNTATTSLYVQTTTVISATGTAIVNAANKAGTAINNSAAIVLDGTKQAIVAVDTLKSGGGAIKAAGDFVQGLTSTSRAPNNTYGAAGAVVSRVLEYGFGVKLRP